MFSEPSIKITDEQVIQQITGGGVSREKGIAALYERHMTLVVKVMSRFNLDEETALDAYTDSVLKLGRLIEQGRYRGESKLFTLLYQITSNRCVDILRKESSKEIEWVDEIPVIPDSARTSLEAMVQYEDVDQLGKLLDEAGERCRQVLMDSLYLGYKIDEVAERNGLKNSHTASSIKSRCLSRLKKLIAARNSNLT